MKISFWKCLPRTVFESTKMTQSIEEINATFTISLLPAILLITVLMLIGLTGNPLVIYYYGYRMKATPSYMFITSLACYDLVSCLVSMPLEILDMVYFVTFQSPMACRILRFVNHFAQLASGGTLLVIAIDRYRKLCHPLKSQFTKGKSRTAILVIVLLSLVSSSPSIGFYTVVDVEIYTPRGTVTGQDCSTETKAPYTALVTAYNSFLMVLFFGGLLTIIVIYSLIARQVYSLRSFKFYTSGEAKAPPSRAISTLTLSSEINSINVDNTDGYDITHGNKNKNGSFTSSKDDENADRGLTPIEEGPSDDDDDDDDDSMLSEKEIDDLTNEELDEPDGIYTIPDLSYRSKLSEFTRNIQKTFRNHVGPISSQLQLNRDLDEDNISTVSKPIRLTKSFTERPCRLKLNLSKPRRTRSEMTVKTIQLFQAKHFTVATNPSRISWIKRDQLKGSINSLNSEGETRVSRCESVDVDQMNMRAQNINTRKLTIVAISITTAFVVSFLPHLVLKMWSTLRDSHEANDLNTSQLVVFQIFVRSFLFNSVCNPFIYGMLNVEFKKMLKHAFRRLLSPLVYLKGKCRFRNNKVIQVKTIHVVAVNT